MEQELRRLLDELIEASKATQSCLPVHPKVFDRPSEIKEGIIVFVLNGKEKGGDGQ